VKVYGRPGVTVLCTGRELREAGVKVEPHQLRNSNGPALRAALENAGISRIGHQIVPDDPRIIAEKMKAAAAKYNVIILTGGVSVGKYDFVPEAVRQIGATVRFHGVAMKPGKPQLYATLSGNRHIFGLPGNPLSVLTGFGELVLPAIRRLSGLDAKSCHVTLKLPLVRSVSSKANRAAFVLGKLIGSGKGLRVRPVESCGSADLVAGAQADGVVLVPKNVRRIAAGELVEFTPWRSIP
jgi:molybdopterin molybdotransferase